MDRMERELAELLKPSPDEPARTVDAGALVRRRRYIGVALAAAAVVAIAVPIALIVTRHPSGSPRPQPALGQTRSTPATSPDDPKAAALRTVEQALANAPLPPGAHEVNYAIAGLTQAASYPASPDLVDRARWWTAPGRVGAAIAYLRAHRPVGMRVGFEDSSGGPSAIQGIDFDGPSRLSLEYSITRYGNGVAIRVDAMQIWVADRPRWSYIPSPVVSVDVTVVRKDPQLHQGAPTVRRTVTGTSAQSLADRINGYGLLPNYGPHSCPAALIGEEWSDTLVFHTAAGRTLRVVESMAGCSFLRVSDGRNHEVLLDGYLDPLVMRTLGLPSNYGGR